MNDTDLQRALKAIGYYKGGIDGALGPQSMRAIADLLLCNIHARLPVISQKRLTESFRTICISALTDRKVGEILAKWNLLVQRSRTRFINASARSWSRGYNKSSLNGLDVCGCCSATAANECDTEFGVEVDKRLSKLIRTKVIDRALGAQHRQTRIGHT